MYTHFSLLAHSLTRPVLVLRTYMCVLSACWSFDSIKRSNHAHYMTTMTMRLTKIAIIHTMRATLGAKQWAHTALFILCIFLFVFFFCFSFNCCYYFVRCCCCHCRCCTLLLSIQQYDEVYIWVSQCTYGCIRVSIYILYQFICCEIRVWARFQANCTCSYTQTNEQTNTHAERSLCVVHFALTGFRFVLFHYNPFNPSAPILPLPLSCIHAYTQLPRFDHFGRSLYSLSFQFDPCDHSVSFTHITRQFCEYVCTIQQ